MSKLLTLYPPPPPPPNDPDISMSRIALFNKLIARHVLPCANIFVTSRQAVDEFYPNLNSIEQLKLSVLLKKELNSMRTKLNSCYVPVNCCIVVPNFSESLKDLRSAIAVN